ncbi:hypothetical protein AAFF_G00175750 [Aldrovandia affinis]|uniref:Uncharacterized protein n=1 Tax=Aldrovandia affinis TaxID=143900 RepID=A0AAD7RLI9_9TELE|nr:hypothetical protein AAFF_G00175750 [Aldrovandia affinis]
MSGARRPISSRFEPVAPGDSFFARPPQLGTSARPPSFDPRAQNHNSPPPRISISHKPSQPLSPFGAEHLFKVRDGAQGRHGGGHAGGRGEPRVKVRRVSSACLTARRLCHNTVRADQERGAWRSLPRSRRQTGCVALARTPPVHPAPAGPRCTKRGALTQHLPKPLIGPKNRNVRRERSPSQHAVITVMRRTGEGRVKRVEEGWPKRSPQSHGSRKQSRPERRAERRWACHGGDAVLSASALSYNGS